MKDLILDHLYVQNTPILVGPPGCGKTKFVFRLVKDLGLRMIYVCLSHKADNEVHGQPVVAKEPLQIGDRKMTAVEIAPPDDAVHAVTATENGGLGALVFLEDLTYASPQTQAPALALVQEHVWGGLHLSRESVGFIAACNPPDLTGGGHDLTPPMANRLAWLPWALDAADWVAAFPGYWDDPPVVRRWGKTLDAAVWARNRLTIAAFIRSMPDQLLCVPEDVAARSGPWPSPRSWDNASRALARAEQESRGETHVRQLLCGSVGDGAALAYLAWREKADLPDPAAIVDDPDNLKELPKDRSDILYYIVLGCVEETAGRKRKSDASPKNQALHQRAVRAWRNTWEVLKRIRLENGPKDVYAVGGHMLIDPSRTPSGEIGNPPEEVDHCVKVPKAAGVNWTKDKKKKK